FYKHIDWNDVDNWGFRDAEEATGTNTIAGSKGFIQNYYPNPVHDNFTIELGETHRHDELQLNVYDMTGRKLFDYSGRIEEVNKYLSSKVLPSAGSQHTLMIRLSSLHTGESGSITILIKP